MYLLAVLSECFMLLSLPPNRRVCERAYAFRANLAAAIAHENYRLAGLVAYPSDGELVVLRSHRSFAPFVELIWRKRLEKIAAQQVAEDARDSVDLSQALQEANA